MHCSFKIKLFFSKEQPFMFTFSLPHILLLLLLFFSQMRKASVDGISSGEDSEVVLKCILGNVGAIKFNTVGVGDNSVLFISGSVSRWYDIKLWYYFINEVPANCCCFLSIHSYYLDVIYIILYIWCFFVWGWMTCNIDPWSGHVWGLSDLCNNLCDFV